MGQAAAEVPGEDNSTGVKMQVTAASLQGDVKSDIQSQLYVDAREKNSSIIFDFCIRLFIL